MFTIRVIHPSDSESVFSAKHVIKEPKMPTMRTRLDFYDEQYNVITVAGLPYVEYGDVFVMNENGKTIATYHLNEP